jgi:hypothetical protein
MRTKAFIAILLFNVLTACQIATPEPINGTTDTEITLSAGQMVTITDADLSITFISVSADERCPSEIECAMSGPVTIQLSIRDQNGTVSEQVLQTFTDSSGVAPSRGFEGIKSHVTVGAHEIKIIRVLPYPKNRSSSIQPSEYMIALQVTPN